MENPSPFPRRQVTPVLDDEQVNGPRVTDCPYCKVGVPSPAFPRHDTPVHRASVPSGLSVTDLGGEIVRQEADVVELGPRLKSISQLMFPEGEKNSVSVALCGCRVPPVDDDEVVVDVAAVVGVVFAAVTEVVDVVAGELLEQAASQRAPLSTRVTGATRRTRGEVCTDRA
jgi:hypothetical protein